MQKSTNILDILSERVHYDIIPSMENDKDWNVRINEEFPETIIHFGAIEFKGKNNTDPDGNISFNFKIVSSPDETLSVNDLTLQEYSGRILNSILEKSARDGGLVLENSKGQIMTQKMKDRLEKEYNTDEH